MGGRTRIRTAATGAALAALVAGCAAQPPAAPPAPAARVVPQPSAPPAPPPAAPDWRDVPLTPGEWTYSTDAEGSGAAFGPDPAAPAFLLRCDVRRREVGFSRPAAPAAALVVRTSYGVRTLPAPRLAASDPLLDEIAFSRGRFTIEADGAPPLAIPAWAEPARVIEDCRD